MKYEIIKEELEIDSDINSLDKNFRKYLNNVFSSIYIKKIDRVFKEPLAVNEFSENNNVMAVTKGNKIFVNKKMFESLPTDKAMMYIIHELFHVLQNNPQFKDMVTLNERLKNITLKYVPVDKINTFLTGKEQDIHSDYKDEFLSYCSNFAFDWKMCPNLKKEYYKLLSDSGIFNMSSDWWKRRFEE